MRYVKNSFRWLFLQIIGFRFFTPNRIMYVPLNCGMYWTDLTICLLCNGTNVRNHGSRNCLTQHYLRVTYTLWLLSRNMSNAILIIMPRSQHNADAMWRQTARPVNHCKRMGGGSSSSSPSKTAASRVWFLMLLLHHDWLIAINRTHTVDDRSAGARTSYTKLCANTLGDVDERNVRNNDLSSTIFLSQNSSWDGHNCTGIISSDR